MNRKFFDWLIITLLLITVGNSVWAEPQNTVVIEYKTSSAGSYNLSAYGYLKHNLVFNVIDLSTANPYLLTGYYTKLGSIAAEVEAGPVFSQEKGRIGAWALDMAISGSPIKDAKVLCVLELAKSLKNQDWLFSKLVVSYKTIGIVTTIYKPEGNRAVIKSGPFVCWNWGNYDALTINWPYNFSDKRPNSLCFKYTKKTTF